MLPNLQASRDDVLDALDELDADRQSSRPSGGRKGEESKDGGGDSGTGGVDLVAFIRLMRHRPRQALGSFCERRDQSGNLLLILGILRSNSRTRNIK